MAKLELNHAAVELAEEDDFLSAFRRIDAEGSGEESANESSEHEHPNRFGNRTSEVCLSFQH